MLKSGKIKALKNEVVKFEGEGKGVVFLDGTKGEFDVVVFATGFVQRFPFFSDELVQQMRLPALAHSGRFKDNSFGLYRQIIPIAGPQNIGFVGFLYSLQNATSYEMSAHWLTEYFLGHIQLPSVSEMSKDVDEYLTFEKNALEVGGGCGYYISGAQILHCDLLMADMKLTATRRHSNFISEYFAPYYPVDYKTFQQEKVARRTNRKTESFYFGFGHMLFVLLLAFFILWVIV